MTAFGWFQVHIKIHIGAHATGGPLLLRGLLKNKGVLDTNGIVVPGPARYRELLPDIMKRVKGNPATAETQELVLDQIVETEKCEQLILGFDDAICVAPLALSGGQLYARAGFKLPWLRNVFADHSVEFILGLRNPASFIPEVFAQCGPKKTYQDFVDGADLDHLRWSQLIKLIRERCPDATLTTYAFEDTPLSWPALLRDVAGVGPKVALDGAIDMLGAVMKREGVVRLRTYLETHKPKDDTQQQRIMSVFLDKYLDEEKLDAEIDLPGWTDDLVARMTATYEDDLYLIEGMSGVRVIG